MAGSHDSRGVENCRGGRAWGGPGIEAPHGRPGGNVSHPRPARMPLGILVGAAREGRNRLVGGFGAVDGVLVSAGKAGASNGQRQGKTTPSATARHAHGRAAEMAGVLPEMILGEASGGRHQIAGGRPKKKKKVDDTGRGGAITPARGHQPDKTGPDKSAGHRKTIPPHSHQLGITGRPRKNKTA